MFSLFSLFPYISNMGPFGKSRSQLNHNILHQIQIKILSPTFSNYSPIIIFTSQSPMLNFCCLLSIYLPAINIRYRPLFPWTSKLSALVFDNIEDVPGDKWIILMLF